ncbi:MAG: cytochrome c [Gammaproteobacteria bacterium]|nr:cytochrome c [Gammaproteobacteria bacterium]MDH3447672.1 cytochrome c [Gammaproteobacteria bacterium]
MKNLIKFANGIFLIIPLIGTQAGAAEKIEIPFHLGQGQLLYEKYCGSCHGIDLGGSDKGPPLVHPFYKPSHHGDKAFYRAALQGTKQHHWKFGDMEPVAGMTPKKMDSVVPYVRYYQQQKKLF